jgi:hypothetical protein
MSNSGSTGPVATASGFLAVRGATELLAAPLSTEDQTAQPISDVSPTKWHRAHATLFWEQFVLLRFASGYSPYNGWYLELFDLTYGEPHQRVHAHDGLSRPGVAEIAAYREAVDEAMVRFLATEQRTGVRRIVELGLHHEQQHQELMLADIKYVLGVNPMRPAYGQEATAAGTGRSQG